jgi:hypothetical protein
MKECDGKLEGYLAGPLPEGALPVAPKKKTAKEPSGNQPR